MLTAKHARDPGAPVILLRDTRKFDIILKTHGILFALALDLTHFALDTSCVFRVLLFASCFKCFSTDLWFEVVQLDEVDFA